MSTGRDLIEIGASVIDGMAVAFVVGTFVWATVRFLMRTGQRASNTFEIYKFSLSKSLSLALEFLVAADVIRTVTTPPTFRNIGILAAVIVTRTLLSWSLVIEMEGRWPWQAPNVRTSDERA